MKHLLRKAMFVVMALTASCGASIPPAGYNDMTAAVTQTDEVVWIHIVNMRNSPINITAVSPAKRIVLGEAARMTSKGFSLEVGDGIDLAMEIRLEDGYRCITNAIFAVPNEILTLRLIDNYPSTEFCTPLFEPARPYQDV